MSSRKQQGQELERNLTVKGKLNYPYYLGDAILTSTKAVLSMEYSEYWVIEASKNLRKLIPETWEDEKFEKDLKDAMKKTVLDKRPWVVAGVRMSKAACEKIGIPAFVEKEMIDYEKLFTACINLLDRRGLTTSKLFTEIQTGVPFGQGELEEHAETETDEI